MHPLHTEILNEIKLKSGKPTKHTFLETYLGNSHKRYPISNPVLREIAKTWSKKHATLTNGEFTMVLTSLIEGESFTEKIMGGLLLDYCKTSQRDIAPTQFNNWLTHLEGWAEIDVLCTSKFCRAAIPDAWPKWSPMLNKLSKSKEIAKRRASLVFLCPVFFKPTSDEIVQQAFELIDRVKHEKEVLITKAISWLLRSMIKYQKSAVDNYLKLNETTLPSIAVRETKVKLKTGRKSKNPVKKK